MKKAIPELRDVEDKVEGAKKLEVWCGNQMELDSGLNSETFDLVKKYCLIRSISSQLSRERKTLLMAGTHDEQQGKATYEQRKTQQSTRADVGLEGDGDITQDLPRVKAGCSSNSEKDFLASGSLYKKVVKGCTEGGASEDEN